MGLPIPKKRSPKRGGGTLPAKINYGRARIWYNDYMAAMKMRVGAGNRTQGLVDMGLIDKEERKAHVALVSDDLKKFEKGYLRKGWGEVKYHHMAEILRSVVGIGERFTVGLIAWIGSPHPGPHPEDVATDPKKYAGLTSEPGVVKDGIAAFDRVSALWKFFGMYPKNGRLVQPEEGQVRPYSAHARMMAYLIGMSFIAQGARGKGPYGSLYARVLKRLELRALGGWDCGLTDARHGKGNSVPEWNGCSPAHLKSIARIITVKRFLADLWEVWREREGLPVTEPYILSQGEGHTREPNLIKNPDGIEKYELPDWAKTKKGKDEDEDLAAVA